jgi:hypothetical protein
MGSFRRRVGRVVAEQRGISSAGRAPALQAGGRRFDPVILHQPSIVSCQACKVVDPAGLTPYRVCAL